ncbi:hypothetical protein Tph_c16800 [Thermacetogenium phaeum DSM 12270]|uniref:Uncharacterized protein n=1 Tax=Thermacetogenium phaeum (strain ATCC BAA-254 / DSM 26808 / PB) TaxID=1089553 RepID=K4LGB2_THEPS|nr:hypothetical protein [Thermacetogenium phaeum]AFV11883.1 hypothetical protein Tph_c16800 [Thermacetogenium phaeum DSM 12270]MDK2881062.1 hypothetical protein [Clostridia bacterium]
MKKMPLGKPLEVNGRPQVRLVFTGGDGLKIAFRLLAKKVLAERERRERCVRQSMPE